MEEMIVVRPNEPGDTKALTHLVAEFRVELKALHGEIADPNLSAARKELGDYTSHEYPIFVAEHDEAGLVGYLVCRVDGKVVWAESLFVLPNFRRKGIASRLYEEAERIAEQLGGETLFNWVHANNAKIVRFLRKRGYTVLNLIELRRPLSCESVSQKIRVGSEEFDY